MSDYDWEGDHTLQIPYHQVIAYSLHIRGFTRHPSSKVKAKGTFQGVIEKAGISERSWDQPDSLYAGI